MERDFCDQFFEQWKKSSVDGVEDTAFLFRVMRLAAVLNRTLDLLCSEYEITNAQFQALAALNRLDPQPVSAQELMKATVLSSGAVTPMVNQLLKKGFVTRDPNPSDKRQIQVRLTHQGRKLIDAIQRKRWKELKGLSKRFSVSEKRTLSSLLKRLLVKMDPA